MFIAEPLAGIRRVGVGAARAARFCDVRDDTTRDAFTVRLHPIVLCHPRGHGEYGVRSGWRVAFADALRRWRLASRRATVAPRGVTAARAVSLVDEPPLRAELFSTDQMEQHGARLASAHSVTPGRLPDRLLARLAANESVLARVGSPTPPSVEIVRQG